MTETDQDWRAVADRYWDDLLELEPILGTEVGDERFDDRLPDPTAAGRPPRGGPAPGPRGGRGHRPGRPRHGGTDDARPHRGHRPSRPRLPGASPGPACLGQPPVGAGYPPGRHRLCSGPTPTRAARYLRRLGAVPAYLDALAEVAADGARVGQTAPGLVVDRSISQVERLIELAPEDAPPMRPVAESTDGTKDRVATLVRDELWPAYGRYLDALRRTGLRQGHDRPVRPPGRRRDVRLRDAVVDLTGPPRRSRTSWAWRTSSGSTRSAGRSRDRSVRLSGGGHRGVPGRRQRGGQDPGRGGAFGWRSRSSGAGTPPRARSAAAPAPIVRVRPIEAYREADTPFAYYQSPSEDGSRPGVYYVNTGDLDDRALVPPGLDHLSRGEPRPSLPGGPRGGDGERPSLRRFGGILAGSAFIEGWALYCERLADELGLFLDDYERLGMLEAQGMRAARLVVDTGIHAFDWDRERAIATMTDVGCPGRTRSSRWTGTSRCPGRPSPTSWASSRSSGGGRRPRAGGAQGSPCRPSTTTCCRSARRPWPASNGSWRPPTPADRGTGTGLTYGLGLNRGSRGGMESCRTPVVVYVIDHTGWNSLKPVLIFSIQLPKISMCSPAPGI